MYDTKTGAGLFHVLSVSQTPLDPSEYYYYWITVLLRVLCTGFYCQINNVYCLVILEKKIRLYGGKQRNVTDAIRIS